MILGAVVDAGLAATGVALQAMVRTLPESRSSRRGRVQRLGVAAGGDAPEPAQRRQRAPGRDVGPD